MIAAAVLALCFQVDVPATLDGAGSAGAGAWNPAVLATELERHVRYLASDELRGRRAGSEDTLVAARYIAQVLEASGVRPAGDEGTYLQAFPLRGYRHRSAPRLTVTSIDKAGAAAGTADSDRTHSPPAAQYQVRDKGIPQSTAELTIVAARTAEQIPSDARPGCALFLATSIGRARSWLRERQLEGAHGWGMVVVLGDEETPSEVPRPPRNRPLGPIEEGPDPPDWLVAHGPLRAALESEQLASLQLTYDLEIEEGREQNVLGVLPAANPEEGSELGRQAIVVSAHYDHIGVLPEGRGDPDGDRVFNGADDDASGVACILELAGALAAESAPERPIVFLFATAEEAGLWGTHYYLDHPVYPLEETCLNLNFEMVGRPDPLLEGPGQMWLTGYERTNLGPELAELGVDLVRDPRPEQHFFERSDNIAFVRRGVVGQGLSSFGMHDDYHKLSDEADTLDYPHLAACTNTALEALRHLAGGRVDPRWGEGQPETRRR